MMTLSISNAKQFIESFQSKIPLKERVFKGVDVSEIFFVHAVLNSKSPKRIVESGRALGQSTYLLACIYPETQIISIEYDAKSPDSPIALEKLKPFKQVECLFGDSIEMMPKIVNQDDVCIIDGPKDWKALKLAFKLLRKNRPRFVFIHDCNRGSEAREFLEKYVPWAIYSDDHDFIQNFCSLDTYHSQEKIQQWSNSNYRPNDCSYGGTYACIPYNKKLKCLHQWQLFRHRLIHNIKKILKRF